MIPWRHYAMQLHNPLRPAAPTPGPYRRLGDAASTSRSAVWLRDALRPTASTSGPNQRLGDATSTSSFAIWLRNALRPAAPTPDPYRRLGDATSTSMCALLRPSMAADAPLSPIWVGGVGSILVVLQRLLLGSLLVGFLSGCVTATVDEMTFLEPTEGIGDASVVILGRRHAPDYETEFEFIECIGDHIRRGDKSITVLHELQFINDLYPWFEPRTAPLRTEDIDKLLEHKPVAEKFAELKLEYMIWIDGSTVETNSSGSMTCGVGPGGAGCFGFGTWGNASEYEATIWDFTDQAEVGRISANTSGQSYMPAVVVPIPIIAPVQGAACDSLGDQLLKYLSAKI